MLAGDLAGFVEVSPSTDGDSDTGLVFQLPLSKGLEDRAVQSLDTFASVEHLPRSQHRKTRRRLPGNLAFCILTSDSLRPCLDRHQAV